ncbi:alkaline shock response membrane anchor protein AmaP [Streptomyces sp. RKND-216]|uniref:alkaline shock response membrane anchor protein AmaP n=1 Tax=Streptomyces sp. RKND-216 TaxID=2562581 RepID=UPI00109DC89E|nr:alkaline shock response membrane anchor protein AmaP [Streptomyces sp. RKND-216]THA27047.1 alkaline shock response membrane anchor protein AmaP [Streptomyces sp. RKND-216]
MLRTVNRVLLTLAGLLLLVLGLAVLAGGLDLQRRWGYDLGSAWPWKGPGDVLLTDADRTRFRDDGWWWPVVIAGLAVLVLLLLWWFLAQLRRRRLGEVLVESGDGEGALLRGRALADVLAAEAESLAGVDRVRVRLLGRRTRPSARVDVRLEPHGRPAATVERLRAEALEHARISAGLDALPAEVRLRGRRHRAERVT